jgi:hypothetical protein
VELHTAKKSNSVQLLEDLVKQQNKLESEIYQIHEKQEAERMKLIEPLQEVEKTAHTVISQLLACSASWDSKHLQHLSEMEQEEEQRLLNVAQGKYQSYRRKDVIHGSPSRGGVSSREKIKRI